MVLPVHRMFRSVVAGSHDVCVCVYACMYDRFQELALGANDISIIQMGASPTISMISPPCR